jgi:hypothetical protein
MSRDLPVVVICTESPALAALTAADLEKLGRGTATRVVRLNECIDLDPIRLETGSPRVLLIIRELSVVSGRISITGFGVSPVSTWREDVVFDPSASPSFQIRLSEFTA